MKKSIVTTTLTGLAALLGMSVAAQAAQTTDRMNKKDKAASAATEYPNKSIRFIVPFPTGSGPDANARVLAAGLTRSLEQQVLIDNRPGASGMIGTQLAAKSTADGYTLLLAATSVFAIGPNLYEKLPYDLDRDFIPISMIEQIPCALVVNPSVPAKTVADLIALAKAKPGQLNYGTGGNGTIHHLSAELFKSLTGTDMRHIPYGAGGPYADLVGGQLPLMFDTLSPFLPNVKAGKLRALALSGKQRRPQIPDVPTFIEAGVPAFESTAWYGPVAPAGTARPLIVRIHTAVVDMLKSPEVREKLTSVSAGYVVGNTPEEFAALIQADRAKWGKVSKQAGVKLEL
jgi:tripartite-type tricarboxylate transporter receptor subunit TctC